MKKYIKTRTITSYECDRTSKLRLRSLFNFFQDLADDHANEMGFGQHECIKKNVGWIGGAYHVQIHNLPKWEDKISVQTWPSGTTAVTGIRDFQILDDEDNVLVNATSQWVLVDLERMRPTSISKNLGHYIIVADRALDSAFTALPVVERVDYENKIAVRYDDIDIYQHVNNAVYPTLIFDGLPTEFADAHMLFELQIAFKKPAILSDTIHVKSQIEGKTTFHQLFNESGDVEFARIKADWK